MRQSRGAARAGPAPAAASPTSPLVSRSSDGSWRRIPGARRARGEMTSGSPGTSSTASGTAGGDRGAGAGPGGAAAADAIRSRAPEWTDALTLVVPPEHGGLDCVLHLQAPVPLH